MKSKLLGLVVAAVLFLAVDRASAREPMNEFLSECLTNNSANDYAWNSVVDFFSYHSSWSQDYIEATCNLLTTLPEQAACWGNSLDALLDPAYGDLAVMKSCVCQFFSNLAGEDACPGSRRKREIPSNRRPTLDLFECPFVDQQAFSDMLVAQVGTLTDPVDLTFEDFASVARFVSEQALCQGLCTCTTAYNNVFMPTDTLPCDKCWPTRLLGLTRDSSEIQTDMANIVASMGSLETPQPTATTCVGDTVRIDLGRSDLYQIEYKDGDDLVVWNTSVITVDEVDPQCCVPTNNSIVFPLGNCNPTITHEGDVVTYEHTIWKVLYTGGSDVISRASFGFIIARCAFNRTNIIDYDGKFLPTQMLITINETAVSGQFRFTLGFFTSDYSAELAPPAEVVVPEWVHIRATLHIDTPQIKLQALDCWATPSSNASDSLRYDILIDRCAVNETHRGSEVVEIIDNGGSRNVDLRLRSYVWTHSMETEVYVHCMLRACDSTAENCVLACPASRKRRDVLTDKYSSVEIASSGPIKIVRQEDINPCSKDNGGCAEMCEVIRERVHCSCFPGRQRSRDGRTCEDPDYSPTATFGQSVIIILMLMNVAMIAYIMVARLRAPK